MPRKGTKVPGLHDQHARKKKSKQGTKKGATPDRAHGKFLLERKDSKNLKFARAVIMRGKANLSNK